MNFLVDTKNNNNYANNKLIAVRFNLKLLLENESKLEITKKVPYLYIMSYIDLFLKKYLRKL